MNKKFSILLGVILMLLSIIAQAATIAIQDNRATADYWVGKNKPGEAVFVATADLDMLNLQIRQKSLNTIVNLAEYPEKVYTQWMTNKITATMKLGKFDKPELPKLFKGGSPLTDFSYTQAQKNCGLEALPAVCVVRYALTTDRTNLRLLPEENDCP